MELYRHPNQKLQDWKISKNRGPLLLIGARQVGKTTYLRKWAKENCQNLFEINFWKERNDSPLKKLFETHRDAKKILTALELHFEKKINIDQDILLIDEIQECPSAYESFKSFKEDLPQFKILSTGSYLQLFIKNNTELKKLPVGCVDFAYLYPLTYSEFVANSSPTLFEKLSTLLAKDIKIEPIDPITHEKLLSLLYEYFFTGGMPEAVKIYLENKNSDIVGAVEKTRSRQKTLLSDYIADFHKYSFATDVTRLANAFKNIPWHLEKFQEESTARIKISDLEKGARFSQYQSVFDYLENASLMIKTFTISKLDLPLRSQEVLSQRHFFKAFFFDIGLLNAALDTPAKQLLDFHLSHYKGYLAENFVAQTLRARNCYPLYSYQEKNGKNSAEIEFLFNDRNSNLIPIEVKSSRKSQNAKSLAFFMRKYQSVYAYKLTPSASTLEQDRIIHLPIYLAEKLI
jgi:predicted AAA+ superfamily ATPase